MLTYFHPLTAGVAVGLLAYIGSLGLRARNDRRQRAVLLRQHVRLASLMYGAMIASWPIGVLTTWGLRPDLEVADSVHFRFGIALVLALTGSWLTGRGMSRREWRNVHPWFGVAAMLLAAAQVFFGLQITP